MQSAWDAGPEYLEASGGTTHTMKTNLSIFLAALLLASGGSLRADVTFADLFHLMPEEAAHSLGSERVKTLQAAVEDYNAVLKFKPPIDAHLVTKTQVIEGRSIEVNEIMFVNDGGTRTYEAHGYHLTVVHRFFTLGGASETGILGYMYGPVITFDDKMELGDLSKISSVSFYPVDKLNQLLKEGSSSR